MSSTETQQLISKIIDHALEGNYTEFTFLRSWSDYKYYKNKRRSFNYAAHMLQGSANRIFKAYCKSVKEGTANFNKLLVYQQLQNTVAFYKKEVETFTEMLYEYDAYLLEGHYLAALLGEIRADKDLVDFRCRY